MRCNADQARQSEINFHPATRDILTASEFPQKYFKTVAYFSDCENDHQPTTIYHPIHHNFTTKTPRKNTHFSNTPLKKRP